MEERMRRRRRVREGKGKTKPKTEIVQVTCHAGTEPRALECLQSLCSLHCLHGDRRLVPKRTVTIRYAYRLPEAANLKGQLVTAGNTIQGEPSRFLAVLLDIICFFDYSQTKCYTSIISILSLPIHLCVCGIAQSISLTRCGQLSFLSFAQPHLPYRGFISNFTSTSTYHHHHHSLSRPPSSSPESTLLIYRDLLVSSSASLSRATSLSSVRLESPQWTGNDGGRVARRC